MKLDNELKQITKTNDMYEILREYMNNNRLTITESKEDKGVSLCYRGQSDFEWLIRPSIERSGKQEQKLLVNDTNINVSLFDRIARIQHYQTGTRFIDFTLNPDVALYFACAENPDKDGAFYIWSYTLDSPIWYRTIMMNELLNIESNDFVEVCDFSARVISKYSELYEYFPDERELSTAFISFADYGFMVKPQNDNYANNIRLLRQQGCFFICGVKFEKQLESWQRWSSNAGKQRFLPHSIELPKEFRESNGRMEKICVPKEYKEYILRELEQKGITNKYLFPD